MARHLKNIMPSTMQSPCTLFNITKNHANLSNLVLPTLAPASLNRTNYTVVSFATEMNTINNLTYTTFLVLSYNGNSHNAYGLLVKPLGDLPNTRAENMDVGGDDSEYMEESEDESDSSNVDIS